MAPSALRQKSRFVLLTASLILRCLMIEAASASIDTRDHLSLKANFVPPQSHQPVVIMLHGLSSVKEEWIPLEKELQKKGWGTLSYDAREVKVANFDPFAAMIDDVESVYSFVKSKTSSKISVFLVGASLGANISLQAALRPSLSPALKGLVLLSPGLRYQSIDSEGPIQKFKKAPVLLVASQQDQYAHDSCLLLHMKAPATVFWDDVKPGHGVQMFDPAFLSRLVTWLENAR